MSFFQCFCPSDSDLLDLSYLSEISKTPSCAERNDETLIEKRRVAHRETTCCPTGESLRAHGEKFAYSNINC